MRFSFNFFLTTRSQSQHARGQKGRASCEMRRDAATTGRLLLTETTRGCSRKIIHEPSREAEFNLALRQRSAEKKGEVKRERSGEDER